MKKFYAVAIIALMTMCCNLFAQTSSEGNHKIPEESIKYVSNQVYWQVKTGTEVPVFDVRGDVRDNQLNRINGLAAIVENYQITRIEKSFRQWRKDDAIGRTFTVHFADNRASENLVDDLSRLSATSLSEKIPYNEVFQAPNDPLYPQQWYLPHVNAEAAWAINDCGGSNVVIAIVDDAVLTSHQDLASKVVPGFDVADNDADPNPPTSVGNPYFSHGTHVAGIAGAATNNSVGMASMGHHCMIMPVKTKSDGNTTPGGLDNPYDGVLYAINNGADVINMSWGGYGYSSVNAAIMSQAYNAGIVCVAAAGNDNAPTAAYPAAYPNVIGVGATDANDQKASFSNYGLNVDVMAPGVGILSSIATSTSAYDSWSGTSMASPIVAGLAGLYLCEHGGNVNTNPNTFAQCLYDHAADITAQNPNFPNQLGAGLIQADDAVDCEPSAENDCPPGSCELVPNWDFETPSLASLQTYSNLHAFENAEVCGWRAMTSSPQMKPTAESADNYAFLWGQVNGGESIQTIDPLPLIANTTYILEYDYRVIAANNGAQTVVDNIFITFEGDNVNPTTATGTVVDHQISVQPTATFQHRVVTFTTPANGAHRHLSVYPRQTSGSGSPNQGNMGIDNITIRPFLTVTAWADQDTICNNTCTPLHATAVGGDYVIWEPAYGLSDPNSYDPIACPDETTTYTVTVYDEETGCTTSADVTVVVIPCEPPVCDDIITVEGICTEDGILLTAYINGVVIDPTSTSPTYMITWDGTTVDYVNDNPVLYPIGEAYTLNVGVIYDLSNPQLCCHYELDLVAQGELDISIEATQDTICQFTCTQLSVNAPAGSIITWTPTTDLDDPTSANPIACPLETTTYDVEVYDPITGCSGKSSITIVVDKECDCDDVKVEVVQECLGYDVVTKVLINGIAIDPSNLSWISINWDVVGGPDIVDENCVILPVGTQFQVHVTYGINLNVPSQCCHYYFNGEVKDLECVNCEFSIIETCKDGIVCLTMVNSAGIPVVPGNMNGYYFQIWWDYNQTIYVNQNPFCVPAGSVYGATIRIFKGEQLLCTNSVKGHIADCCHGQKDCCSPFNSKGIAQTYTPGEDIVVTWDPNGAVTYEIDVVHNYSGCSPNYCHFEINAGTTYVSLASEGCFNVCEEYQITVTAICADGTTYQVTLPKILAYPADGTFCLACEEPNDGEVEVVGDGDGKGKRSVEENIDTNVSIYPNPATNLLNIKYGLTAASAQIEIFDFSGKQVLYKETTDTSATSIDISNLDAAVYIVKVTIDGQESSFNKLAVIK
ncbi:MAG: S8/S53 family peptidase [Chitinophagales bacterium]